MTVGYHSDFKKQYKKLSFKIRKKFNERLELFLLDPFHPLLNNHSLAGKYSNYRSINVTGDVRAIYFVKNTIAVFITIGSHSQLFN